MRSSAQVFLGLIVSGVAAAAVGSLSVVGRKLVDPPDYRTPGLAYPQLLKARQWRGIAAMGKALLVVGALLIIVGAAGLLTVG